MNESVKNVAWYMAPPYTTVLRRDEDNDVVARIEELPGVAHGSDEAEAIENLREMQRLWLEECAENGHDVPVPAPESVLPSGKVTSLLSQAAGGGVWEKPAQNLPARRSAREAAPDMAAARQRRSRI